MKYTIEPNGHLRIVDDNGNYGTSIKPTLTINVYDNEAKSGGTSFGLVEMKIE